MVKISIIGAGFSGTMLVVHLLKNINTTVEINLINESDMLNAGIAFHPYSKKSLLNVISAKMSAFADEPDHFLNWLMLQDHFHDKDRALIANSDDVCFKI